MNLQPGPAGARAAALLVALACAPGRHAGSVPAGDGPLVGIYRAAIDDGHNLGELNAGEIMTGNPYSIRPETNLGTLVHVLRASDLVRVPVVDAKDRLVGIIEIGRAHV